MLTSMNGTFQPCLIFMKNAYFFFLFLCCNRINKAVLANYSFSRFSQKIKCIQICHANLFILEDCIGPLGMPMISKRKHLEAEISFCLRLEQNNLFYIGCNRNNTKLKPFYLQNSKSELETKCFIFLGKLLKQKFQNNESKLKIYLINK
jgi:hypothetical protein